jgi:hypothetical protein
MRLAWRRSREAPAATMEDGEVAAGSGGATLHLPL